MMVNGVHWDRGIGKIWWDGIHNSKPIVNHKLTIFHLDTVDGRNNLLSCDVFRDSYEVSL